MESITVHQDLSDLPFDMAKPFLSLSGIIAVTHLIYCRWVLGLFQHCLTGLCSKYRTLCLCYFMLVEAYIWSQLSDVDAGLK